MSLIGNVIKPLTKRVLIPLGLITAASATNAAVYEKMFRSGFKTLIIYNEVMNDIMKIVKSLEELGLLIKGVSETNKNEQKEQKGGFLRTLGASLLRSLLIGKGIIRAADGTISEQVKIFNAVSSFN